MKKFSVLLLLPDTLASNYGEETYLAHVKAEIPFQAIGLAQVDAVKHLVDEEDDTIEPADFYPLLCCRGWVEDLNTL